MLTRVSSQALRRCQPQSSMPSSRRFLPLPRLTSDAAAGWIEIALREGERFADSEPCAPEHDDQCSRPQLGGCLPAWRIRRPSLRPWVDQRDSEWWRASACRLPSREGVKTSSAKRPPRRPSSASLECMTAVARVRFLASRSGVAVERGEPLPAHMGKTEGASSWPPVVVGVMLRPNQSLPHLWGQSVVSSPPR
jgi:hypothetical protein